MLSENKNVEVAFLEESIQSSFLDYSMSVIASRALPDVRDGLKPVHRRILHSMNEQSIHSNKAFSKSARVVGDVMGNYHPHGDSSIYEALIRMAQPWSLMANLTQVSGNYGSIDGDSAAAMRYTGARMSPIGEMMLKNIDKDNVDFMDNYDGSNKEPTVLPSKFPNLLVNGSQGIAVGMASNIPSHNLNEVCDAVIAYLHNNDLTTEELLEIMPGPDFPTGGDIMGDEGIKKAYETGRGSIRIRGRVSIEEEGGVTSIVIRQLPYQVNAETLRAKIEEVQTAYDEFKKRNRSNRARRFSQKMPNKALNFIRRDGLHNQTDFNSSEDDIRIVIELIEGVDPRVVVNHLFKYTPLESSFGINNTVLLPQEDGTSYPARVPMTRLISEYAEFQKKVVTREVRFDLGARRNELYFLSAMIKSLDELDEVIKIIREAKTNEGALEGLMGLLSIEKEQAQHILSKRIRTLTGAQQEETREKFIETEKEIERLEEILNNEQMVIDIIVKELTNIKEKYGQERRTRLQPPAEDLTEQDLIQNESIVATISRNGYIKATLEERYRTQRRYGRGVYAMNLDEDDYISHLEILNKHDSLLLVTNLGKVFKIKGYNIPELSPRSKGVHIHNIVPGLEDEEKIQSVISIKVFTDKQYLFFSTQNGIVKKTVLSEYENINRNGKIALLLDDGDRLVNATLTDGKRDIILITAGGKSITFKESDVRATNRRTRGVIGINLDEDDKVVSADIQEKFGDILFVTKNGMGKRTSPEYFKVQNRGGKGAIEIRVTDRTGPVKAATFVTDDDLVYVLTELGSMIRIEAANILRYKRDAQGVGIINLRDDDSVIVASRASEVSNEDNEKDD